MTYEEGQALTARWLGQAGLRPGQRVLDVGAGPGNLARLAFQHLDPGGSLVGLDRHEAFLAQARAQHADRDARFLSADLDGELPSDLGSFDVIIGRRVLMYLRDPVATLRRLRPLLRPGGVIFFQELVIADAPPALGLHNRAIGWLRTMLAAEGASSELGASLSGLFLAAGLPAPVVRAEADVAAPGQPDSIADRIRFVLPRLEEVGIPAREIDVDTLAVRLRAERDRTGQAWLGDLAVAAWVQVP
jgi:SAM-dependent methyltransferase